MDRLFWNQLVFLFTAVQLISADVVPPMDITLHCHNLQNTVHWSYRRPSPDLLFRVDVRAVSNSTVPDSYWVSPPILHANISQFSNPNDDYLLTVTAVVGQSESEPAPAGGIAFSYFTNSLADQKCSLDLPSVNVSEDVDDQIHFSFQHPWLLYHRRLPAGLRSRATERDNQRLPEFKYDVSINKEQQYSFICEEEMCEEKLPRPTAAAGSQCLTVTGELLLMEVQGRQEYCALLHVKEEEQRNNHAILFAALALVVVAAACGLFFMICRKMTEPSSTFPESMVIKGRLRQWTLGTVREPVDMAQAVLSSPTDTEENESVPEPDLPPSPRVSSDGGDHTEVEQLCVEVDGDDDVAPSHYHKRPVVVSLAPGEEAEGYRG